jgi:hypothetical protein
MFFDSNNKNVWLISDDYQIYIRKSKRLFNDCFYDCIDLANINIKNKGEKIFSQILENLLQNHENINIFVESIINERFLKFFLKKGFILMDNDSVILIRY